jgi:hypothetical protein
LFPSVALSPSSHQGNALVRVRFGPLADAAGDKSRLPALAKSETAAQNRNRAAPAPTPLFSHDRAGDLDISLPRKSGHHRGRLSRRPDGGELSPPGDRG